MLKVPGVKGIGRALSMRVKPHTVMARRVGGVRAMPGTYEKESGFDKLIPGGTPSNEKAGPAPGTTDGGLSMGVIHNKQQEQNIRDKALGGGVITNDDLHGYLGHMANDDVLRKGHNVGHKPKGKHAAVTSLARKGFKKLPGTGANQVGHARYGDAPTGLQTRAEKKAQSETARMLKRSLKGGSDTMAFAIPPTTIRKKGTSDFAPNSMPPLASDKKMSIRHHEDSIKFNIRHARDHEAAAKKHQRELKAVRKTKPPKK